jgi:hypothetical protein
MSTALENFRHKLVTAKRGTIFYEVDITRVYERTAPREIALDKIGNTYIYFGNGMRCYRNSDSQQLDNPKRANYTINNRHFVFATMEDAMACLDAARDKERSQEEWREFRNQFEKLSRDKASWSAEKRQRVLDAMMGE